MVKSIAFLIFAPAILAAISTTGLTRDAIEPAPIWERPLEAEKDRLNLELNPRWMLSRLRNADGR